LAYAKPNVDLPSTREAVLGGMCFDSTLNDASSLTAVRRDIVQFNLKKRSDDTSVFPI
jgi:hypothetical protein